MEPFVSTSGVAAPLLQDDINTDMITPIQRRRSLKPDYGAMLFSAWRRNEAGEENPDFVLNKPQFRNARILVTGRNFGCGSSREGAVWAMAASGIRCIVARSFADIYRENCLKNGVLPVTLAGNEAAELEALVVSTDGAATFAADLQSQTVTAPGGRVFKFEIEPFERMALLEGLDDIGLTLKNDADISDWESRIQGELPWLQELADNRRTS